MSRHLPEITLYPERTAVFLGKITILLVLAHLFVNLIDRASGNDFARALAHGFSLNVEKNVPSCFAACLWIINAMLFFMVWKTQCIQFGRRWIWLLLSGLFCFLAIDEYFSIHEPLAHYLRTMLDTSGVFFYAWIIPYGTGVIVLAMLMLPVLWKLDNKTRFWFITSAITFISGSIGLEMIEGWYFEMMQQKDVVYFWMMTAEETIEMAGLVMLVYPSLLLLGTGHE